MWKFKKKFQEIFGKYLAKFLWPRIRGNFNIPIITLHYSLLKFYNFFNIVGKHFIRRLTEAGISVKKFECFKLLLLRTEEDSTPWWPKQYFKKNEFELLVCERRFSAFLFYDFKFFTLIFWFKSFSPTPTFFTHILFILFRVNLTT